MSFKGRTTDFDSVNVGSNPATPTTIISNKDDSIMLKENTEIYILREYRWIRGELISTGKKNHKVKFRIPGCLEQTSYVSKEKCAHPEELVAVVWMTKKGRNGRGGYRVERELYPDLRVPARTFSGSWRSDSDGFIEE